MSTTRPCPGASSLPKPHHPRPSTSGQDAAWRQCALEALSKYETQPGCKRLQAMACSWAPHANGQRPQKHQGSWTKIVEARRRGLGSGRSPLAILQKYITHPYRRVRVERVRDLGFLRKPLPYLQVMSSGTAGESPGDGIACCGAMGKGWLVG